MQNDWIDEFIQEVKKLAYDMPAPNPYTPMLLAHCLEAERHRVDENMAAEAARFRALSYMMRSAESPPQMPAAHGFHHA